MWLGIKNVIMANQMYIKLTCIYVLENAINL
jgi:hypothetical protein